MNHAPATFLGVQPGILQLPDVELYVLTAAVGHHPAGSTVSRATLERHGYTVPSLTAEKRQAKEVALVGY